MKNEKETESGSELCVFATLREKCAAHFAKTSAVSAV